MDITRRQLIEAIKDMNQVMELDPPIDTSGSVDSILNQLDEAIESCVDPADEFTMETWDIINARQNGELEVVDKDRVKEGENKGKNREEKRSKVSKDGSKKRGDKKTRFGHSLSSQAGKIDKILEKKKLYKLEEIAKEVGCSVGRVKNHLNHLAKKHGLIIKIGKEGVVVDE